MTKHKMATNTKIENLKLIIKYQIVHNLFLELLYFKLKQKVKLEGTITKEKAIYLDWLLKQ